MLGHEFSSRIASNNTYFIIGKQPFLRLDEFNVHHNSGHPSDHEGDVSIELGDVMDLSFLLGGFANDRVPKKIFDGTGARTSTH